MHSSSLKDKNPNGKNLKDKSIKDENLNDKNLKDKNRKDVNITKDIEIFCSHQSVSNLYEIETF